LMKAKLWLKRLLPENHFEGKLTSEEIKDTSAENRSDSKPIQERKCHWGWSRLATLYF
jgi:hypothetical protein